MYLQLCLEIPLILIHPNSSPAFRLIYTNISTLALSSPNTPKFIDYPHSYID